MAQTIKLKRSSTGGNVPATGDLALGEMAINTNDGLMFIKKNVTGTESICTFHPTIDSGSGSSSKRTLTLDRGSQSYLNIDFADSTLSGNTYIDGNGARITIGSGTGMTINAASNLILDTNSFLGLGASSATNINLGNSNTNQILISSSSTGFLKLPNEVRFTDTDISARVDSPTFKMKLEDLSQQASSLTFSEGVRITSYAFGVMTQGALNSIDQSNYAFTALTLDSTSNLKVIADFFQDRGNSGYYMQPTTGNTTSMSLKAEGHVELGSGNNSYPRVKPYANVRGYLGESTRQWFYLYAYYGNMVGLTITSYLKLNDFDYLYLGTSSDVRMFYDGTNNEMEMELESACTQFKITDNGTTRFTFTKSSGDFTATGNVTAYSDERLKSDIKTLDPSKTLQMRGVEFTKDGKKGSGVIAQELEKIAPELVLDEGDYKSVAYGNLSGYLIETIKDQQTQINELKELVTKLLEK